jgi:hypothetical protein
VANIAALTDAGPTAGSSAPPPPSCETSQLYVLLSSIVRSDCYIPQTFSSFAALSAHFLQNPPPPALGETRPPTECDVFSSRLNFFYPVNSMPRLCPDHCMAATEYVAAEDQRVLACQGF